MNRLAISAIIAGSIMGAACAQQVPPEKPYSPAEQGDMNSAYIAGLENQAAALLKGLLQEQARFTEEHKLRLAAEKARDDALAKVKPTDTKPEDKPSDKP